MDLTIYHGWKIYTHTGKITHDKIPDLKRKIKGWFDRGEWTYGDNSKTLICNKNIDFPIEVIFREETTEQEKSRGLHRYGIVLQSDFFGFRNEYPHRQLCDKVRHKITWQKQAYYLENDEWIPVPKRRILRMKKR